MSAAVLLLLEPITSSKVILMFNPLVQVPLGLLLLKLLKFNVEELCGVMQSFGQYFCLRIFAV